MEGIGKDYHKKTSLVYPEFLVPGLASAFRGTLFILLPQGLTGLRSNLLAINLAYEKCLATQA